MSSEPKSKANIFSESLGDDILAIRKRVLARRQAENAPAAEISAALTEALREKYQVDPDEDETAFAEMEDPGLVAHMECQRKSLNHYQTLLQSIPPRSQLNVKYIGALGGANSVVKRMHEFQRTANDNAALASKRAEAIATIVSLGTPRNAPQNPFRAMPEGASEFFAFFTGEAENTAKAAADAYQFIKESHAEVFKMRREFQYVCDNLLKLVEVLEDERRQLRAALKN
jgi:hypothetical protein